MMTTNSRKTVSMALAVILIGALAFWMLVTPDNPLSSLFRAKISDLDARVIVGPYPLEDDLRILKAHGVTTIVSLLDPQLPYEGVLLERERALVSRSTPGPLGLTRFRQGRREEATHYLESALAIDPDNQEVVETLKRVAPERVTPHVRS